MTSGVAMNSLDLARDRFAALTTGPHPPTLDGTQFAGLPAKQLPLDEVRDLLLTRQCPQTTSDAVWTYLVERARARHLMWTEAALGIALPALIATAAQLACRCPGDPADLHAEVVCGFLNAIHTIDLTKPRIMLRLRWAAYRAGHATVTANLARRSQHANWTDQPATPTGQPGLPTRRRRDRRDSQTIRSRTHRHHTPGIHIHRPMGSRTRHHNLGSLQSPTTRRDTPHRTPHQHRRSREIQPFHVQNRPRFRASGTRGLPAATDHLTGDATMRLTQPSQEPSSTTTPSPKSHRRLATAALSIAFFLRTAGVAWAQGGLGTGGFRNWLLDNIVPLALLVVALLLIWLGGGKGENSQVMKRLLGVLVALAVLGLSVTGAGKDIGTWLANLFRA